VSHRVVGRHVVFHDVAVLAEHLLVVGGDGDNSVFPGILSVETVEHATEPAIHHRDRSGELRADEVYQIIY